MEPSKVTLGSDMQERIQLAGLAAKRCPRCALPETFPGIEFHEGGGCNYCIYYELFSERQKLFKDRLREEFEKVVAEAKLKKGGYHCILCYSGGKDSTFLLHMLRRRYDLNVLAYTFDNGFISPQAFRNIAKVVDNLEVDHLLFRPRSSVTKAMYREALIDNELFSKALLPYSNQCCLSCIAMVLSIALKMGREKDIPLVVIGFTPGQAADVGIESFMKTGSTMFFSTEVNRDDPVDFPKMIRDPLYESVGEEVDRYLIKSQYLEEGERYPRVLYPYHAMVEYDEEQIYETIAQYGWIAPRDTDACSTNCRLNSVAIASHVSKRGYHPYIAEMSCLVREGKMTWEEAIAREKVLASAGVIKDVLTKLDLSPEDIGYLQE
jgi:hypothetical protein